MGEFNEGVWGNAVTIALAPFAEPVLRRLFLKKYGDNAPDDIVAFWSIIFGSALYGTITQAKTNGMEGVYANFLSMLPYGVSFVLVNTLTKKFYGDKTVIRTLSNPKDGNSKRRVMQTTKKEAKKLQYQMRESMKQAKKRRKPKYKPSREIKYFDRSDQRLLIRSGLTALAGYGLNRLMEQKFLKDKNESTMASTVKDTISETVAQSFEGLGRIHSIPHMGRPQAVRVGTIPNPDVHRR